MPATPRRPIAARLAAAVVGLCAAALVLSAQPPENGKKAADTPKASAPAPKDAKESAKPAPPVGLKLPDGTFLWTGPGPVGDGERVLLSPEEHQKLLDQIEQLKKQLAARKGVPPSGCAIRGRVEKRGETAVAALKLTYTFRTSAPNAAVALGGKRAFLVAAALDGNKLPVLDTGDDGFAALVETPGDHTLTLDVECPVAGRGTKTEIGFDLGLPRAAITTLALAPPPGVKRVALTTRTPDPAQPMKPPDTRRVAGLEVKALAAGAGHDGYPLGPVDSAEVAWEPPAAAPAAEAVQSAEITVTGLLAEGFVETTAKFSPRGPAKSWRIAAPADAVLTVDRVAAAPASEPGSVDSPTVTKPADPGKPVWKVDLPAGTTAADWAISAVVRTTRAKAGDPKHRGPFPVGPFAVLDIARQTGTVRLSAAANTRLVVKHGPDVRQEVLPAAVSEDETAALFRFATGPTGDNPPPAPLLTVEAHPLAGKVAITPTYRLGLTDAGWAVRADLRVFPIRTAIDTVMIELPAGWKGPEVGPAELVNGVPPTAADGDRQVLAVQLAAEHRQPFDLVLTATVPVRPAAREAAVLLPRFPGASERGTTATATVPEGLEIRGAGRPWDADQPAAWGQPLSPATGSDGKAPKAVTAVTGKFDRGLARLDLAWGPYRPPLAAEVRAEIAVHDGQLVVSERVKLRSPDGFPKVVRFRGAAGLKALPPFDPVGAGEWAYAPAPDKKDAELMFVFPVSLPPPPVDGSPRRVPVGLVLPTGAAQTETVVRVWVVAGGRRAVAAEPGAWRELPPEPTPDRDVLPALTLAGSGGDLPLVLDIRDTAEAGSAAVWVERGLIQAWAGDGGTTYRARFLLKRWLSDTVEVGLPDGIADGTLKVFLDEKAVPVSAVGPGRMLRVPLPEAKPGRTVVLDVRYKLPPGVGEESVYLPPRPAAAFAGPVRWQITGPGGSVPLVPGGRAEQRWRVRTAIFTPVAASNDDLDRWFQTGAGGDDGAGPTESVVVRLTGPDPVRVYHVQRVTLVIVCSAAVLLLGLAASRLPDGAGGPAVALLAGAAAVAAVLYPQPAAEAAGAAGPGLLALGLVLASQAAARWYYRRRITYLPGFTRGRPEMLTLPSSARGGSGEGSAPSARGRPSPNGSTGPADAPVPTQPASSGS